MDDGRVYCEWGLYCSDIDEYCTPNVIGDGWDRDYSADFDGSRLPGECITEEQRAAWTGPVEGGRDNSGNSQKKPVVKKCTLKIASKKPNNKCGSQHNKVWCPWGKYCSKYGYCGTRTTHKKHSENSKYNGEFLPEECKPKDAVTLAI